MQSRITKRPRQTVHKDTRIVEMNGEVDWGKKIDRVRGWKDFEQGIKRWNITTILALLSGSASSCIRPQCLVLGPEDTPLCI